MLNRHGSNQDICKWSLLLSFYCASCLFNYLWWEGMDLNHRNQKVTDLQSACFSRLHTFPYKRPPAKAITSQRTHAGGNMTALGFFYANPWKAVHCLHPWVPNVFLLQENVSTWAGRDTTPTLLSHAWRIRSVLCRTKSAIFQGRPQCPLLVGLCIIEQTYTMLYRFLETHTLYATRQTFGGAGGIWTHARVPRLAVFKTAPLNHLGTTPCNASYNAAGRAIAGTENALTVHPHMLNASTNC